MEAEGEDAVSASSDSLGEQLYELVDIHNTGFTEKITGVYECSVGPRQAALLSNLLAV